MKGDDLLSYQPHEFQPGDVLLASQLNEMDEGIDNLYVKEVTFSDSGAVSKSLDAGKMYHFTGNLTSLNITLNATNDLSHYHFDFISGSPAVSLTLPNNIIMPSLFSIFDNARFEIDILNNYGVVTAWEIS